MYCVRCSVRSCRELPATPQKRASGYVSFVSIRIFGSTSSQKSESCEPALHLGLVPRDVGDVLVRVGDPDLDDAGHGRPRAAAVVEAAEQIAHRGPRVRRLVTPRLSGRTRSAARSRRGRTGTPRRPCAGGTRRPRRTRFARERIDPVSPAHVVPSVISATGWMCGPRARTRSSWSAAQQRLVGGLWRDRDVVVGAGRRIGGERSPSSSQCSPSRTRAPRGHDRRAAGLRPGREPRLRPARAPRRRRTPGRYPYSPHQLRATDRRRSRPDRQPEANPRGRPGRRRRGAVLRSLPQQRR